MKYIPTIGLEIHVELRTKSKMFCSCPNNPDEEEANINVCPICLGHPGTLPVPNKEAIKKVIKVGVALNCQISSFTRFDRKNYFYPDLPKNYQITQFNFPLCQNGFLEVDKKKIRIKRIHLEEDTGKSIHFPEENISLIDFNRAGIPLMELVTEPDFHSSQEAKIFAKELQLILRYLDVSEANMEKGQMRVEANISISKDNSLGTKVEVKNLNSFRAVERAIEYEIERQKEILERGEKVSQQTLGWDPERETTYIQREKEESHDYRYFPEPDIPPLEISQSLVEEIRREIPELPQEKRERFKREYKISENEIEIFVQNPRLGDYFEKVASELKEWLKAKGIKDEGRPIKLAVNYLISDLQGIISQKKISLDKLRTTPEDFAEFITLIIEGKISSKIAKTVLLKMVEKGKDPSHIIDEEGLSQISDKEEIEKIVDEVISDNQKAVADFKKGKTSAIQFLLGKCMEKTRGRIDPEVSREILRKKLGGS